VSQTIDPKTGKLLDSAPASDTPAQVPNSHPPAIYFFFWGEFAERSSYYGMRAILFMYITTALHYADTEAGPMYSAFKMGCYLLPLLGGFIADRWFGRYWTIVGFSVPYVLGHFILGFSDPTILGDAIQSMSPERVTFFARMLLFVSLALLAAGSGVIKPNISALLGQTYDQKRPGKERLRTAAFLWFYLAINVGALISQLALPAIREWYILNHLTPDALKQAQELLARGEGEGIHKLASAEVVGRAYQIAFMFPTILMAISLAVFAIGKRTYATETINRAKTPEERLQQFYDMIFLAGIFGLFALFFVLDIAISQVVRQGLQQLSRTVAIAVIFPAVLAMITFSVLSAGKRTFAKDKEGGRLLTVAEQRRNYRTLAYLLAIFGLVILFWFGYEHNDTLWIAFIRDYVNLSVRIPFVSKPVLFAPDQLQFLNALFVIILVPTFNITFARIDPDMTIFTPMRKILAGFILTAAAIAIMALAGFIVEGSPGQKVSYIFPAMAYIVLTFGEVLLYGTMLDLSYAAAPKTMKGYVTACFLLTNTLANFLNIVWTPMYGGSLTDPAEKRGPLGPGLFFAITAAVTIAAAVIFVYVGKQFQESRKSLPAA
jgi:dipeptide/tripeptide permease